MFLSFMARVEGAMRQCGADQGAEPVAVTGSGPVRGARPKNK